MIFWLVWSWLSGLSGPAVAGLDLLTEPVQACAGCHATEADRHATSRHAQAWTNPLFQHEYAPAPKPWCVRCHAPDVPERVRDSPPATLTQHGVSCRSCHVRDGKMVSRSRSQQSVHSTRTDPDFGGASMCSGCHQFNFPELDANGVLEHYTSEPMQNTVAEYRRTGVTATCADCHMSRGHRFLGSHDPSTLRRALDVRTCRSGSSLRVDIDNRGAAHNVPSGGVHRHIAVRAWRSSEPAKLATVRFGRTFTANAKGGKKLLDDTTIAAGKTRRLTFDANALGGKTDEPINLRLDYVFQAPDAKPTAHAPEAPLRFWEVRLTLSQLSPCRGIE